MARPYVSVKELSDDHASRIRNFRYMMFGVERPSNPRWLPDIRDVSFLPDMERTRGELAVTANARRSAVTYPMMKKLAGFGLLDERLFEDRSGKTHRALSLNRDGFEFVLKGKLDRTKEISPKLDQLFDRIEKDAQQDELVALRARNSTLDLDRIDFNVHAAKIGVAMTRAGFMAMAYDKSGIRITDVLVEYRGQTDYRFSYDSVFHPERLPPMTDSDLAPAMRLAGLLDLKKGDLFLDAALAQDISHAQSFVHPGKACVVSREFPSNAPTRSGRW